MSTKRLKQYLLLLTAIGLIAIASGGSGTFASFTAEVHNPGNTFATGSLYLHDSVANMSECTSESDANNSNTAETPGDACDTLFTVSNSQFAPNAYLNDAGGGGPYPLTGDISGETVDVSDWNGGTTGLSFGIGAGAEIQFDNGTTTDVCPIVGPAAQGDDSFVLGTCDVGLDSYDSTGSGTLIESDGPFIGHLTLRNDGTIDGKNLKFALDSVAHAGGCDQTVTGLAGSTTLCNDTDFSITEVNSSWAATVDYQTGAITGGLHCAWPTNTATCAPDGTNLGALDTQNPTTFLGVWDQLFLDNGGGTNNTRQPTGVDSTVGHATGSGPGTQGADPGTGLTNPGGARYFMVEIWPGDLANTDMGGTEVFDLIWHMEQA